MVWVGRGDVAGGWINVFGYRSIEVGEVLSSSGLLTLMVLLLLYKLRFSNRDDETNLKLFDLPQ